MSLIAEKENFDPLFSQDFEGNTEEMTEVSFCYFTMLKKTVYTNQNEACCQ